MVEPNPFGAPVNAVVANPFLENPPPTAPPPLVFQEHHLSQGGYQASNVPLGAPGAAAGHGSGFAPRPPQSLYVPSAAPQLYAPEPKRSAPPVRSGFFSIASYTQYFDVDTADVLHRMRLACIPFGTSFASTVADKPDLYGPFWIAATLVFVSAAAGNMSSYLQARRTGGSSQAWAYDVEKVTVSTVIFYGYITVLPLVLYITLRYWGAPTSLLALVTLYGYSLVVYLPIALLCVAPVAWFNWVVVLSGGAVASLCLVLNLRRLLEPLEDAKRKSSLLTATGLSQFGLALALKLYVFAIAAATFPSPPPPMPPLPMPPFPLSPFPPLAPSPFPSPTRR